MISANDPIPDILAINLGNTPPLILAITANNANGILKIISKMINVFMILELC